MKSHQVINPLFDLLKQGIALGSPMVQWKHWYEWEFAPFTKWIVQGHGLEIEELKASDSFDNGTFLYGIYYSTIEAYTI